MSAIVYPLFFATSRSSCSGQARRADALVDVDVGASVMRHLVVAVANAGQRAPEQRWHGTLELLVAAPAPFALTIAAGHARDGDDRASTRSARPCSGARFALRHPDLTRAPALRSSVALPCMIVVDRRASASCSPSTLRPLPHSLGAREPVRVPGLADLRLPRAAVAAARLGAPDLVAARADLGRARDPRGGARRLACCPTSACASCSAAPVRRGRSRVPAARRSDRRAASATLVADVNAARVFFVGGLIELPRPLQLAHAVDLHPDAARRARSSEILLLRLRRPVGGRRVRQLLPDRQRAPVRGDPVPVRDGEHDRRRALHADARTAARHPGQPARRCSSAARCR